VNISGENFEKGERKELSKYWTMERGGGYREWEKDIRDLSQLGYGRTLIECGGEIKLKGEREKKEVSQERHI